MLKQTGKVCFMQSYVLNKAAVMAFTGSLALYTKSKLLLKDQHCDQVS